jgi:hypothetical protein
MRPSDHRLLYTIASTVAITLVVLLWSSSSFAQSVELRAEIPFDFYVSGKLIPAGTYYVTSVGNNGAIRIWDKEGTQCGHPDKRSFKPGPRNQPYGFSSRWKRVFPFGTVLSRVRPRQKRTDVERELEAANRRDPVTLQLAVAPKK